MIDQQDLIRIERMLRQNRYRLAAALEADCFDAASSSVAREIAAELLLDVRPVIDLRGRVPVDTSQAKAILGDADAEHDWQDAAYQATVPLAGVDPARVNAGEVWAVECLGSGMPAPDRSPHFCAVCGRRVGSRFVDGGDTLFMDRHAPDPMSVLIAAQPELAHLLGRVIRNGDWRRDSELGSDEKAAVERIADYLDPDGKGHRTIKVTWSPVAIQDALDVLTDLRARTKPIPPHHQAIDIAIDLLRYVIAELNAV